MDPIRNEQDLRDVAATLDGEASAYTRIVRRYQSLVVAQMRRFSRDPNVVTELTHDVFVEAYQGLAGFRGQAPFEHWLRRIATFTGYRYWRGQGKKQARETNLDEQGWAILSTPAQAEPSEAAELLFRLMEDLAPADRVVLTLMCQDEMSVEEVARHLGWSQVLVRVRAHRARGRLRKKLEALGLGSSGNRED